MNDFGSQLSVKFGSHLFNYFGGKICIYGFLVVYVSYFIYALLYVNLLMKIVNIFMLNLQWKRPNPVESFLLFMYLC